jgi:hypothetical protein
MSGWTHASNLAVVKYNKRLWIKDIDSGRLIYTPPDFLRHLIKNRSDLEELCRDGSNDADNLIEHIMKFESKVQNNVAFTFEQVRQSSHEIVSSAFA